MVTGHDGGIKEDGWRSILFGLGLLWLWLMIYINDLVN